MGVLIWHDLFSYSLAQHGANVDTLYRFTRRKCPSFIVIETSDGDVFGAFTSAPWAVSHSYYGTGECFLFTCYPKFECFPWKFTNSMFMFSNESTIAMGGGYEKKTCTVFALLKYIFILLYSFLF